MSAAAHTTVTRNESGDNPAITRGALSLLLGTQVVWCLVTLNLARSDLPPPSGFVVVVLASVLLGVLVGYAVRWNLRWIPLMGWPGTVARSALAGAGVGAALAVLLALGASAAGSGSSDPWLVSTLVFTAVMAALAAAIAVALTTIVVCADRARTAAGAVTISLLPTLLVAVPAVVVIALRIAG